MAVTVEELAVAVRLSDDGANLSAPQTAILARLKGVGEAHVALLVPDSPGAVADEIVIRLASYLYEAPIGRRDAYSNAWVNSGAGALAARWAPQAASGEHDASTTSTPGGGLSEAAALALIYAWAREGNDDPIPASKLSLGGVAGLDDAAVQALIDTHAAMSEVHHRRSSGAGIVNVEDGRLASNSGTVMRIGWSESQAYDEQVFTRDGNHPDDGAAVGTIAGVFPPVQPATIPNIPDVAANEKYLHIWVGEIPGNVAQLTFFGTAAHGVSTAAAQTYNATDGTWWVSGLPLSAGISGWAFSATVVGALIASTTYVDEAIAAIPASSGFPMTRTQVFNETINATGQDLMATEDWLEGQLYELRFGSTRHLFLTEGAANANFALNYFLPSISTATIFVDVVTTLRIGTRNVFGIRLDNAGAATGAVIINKLT